MRNQRRVAFGSSFTRRRVVARAGGVPVAAALAWVLASATGCGEHHLDNGSQSTSGRLSLTVADVDGLAGFKVEVANDAGAVIVSRFVEPGEGDAFFTLAVGGYQAKVTAMKTRDMADPLCTPSSAHATVRRGATTEVALVVRCDRSGNGGLGVSVGTNHAPTIEGLSFSPGRTVAPCEPMTIAVAASDADGDALTYQFAADSAAPGTPVSFTIEATGTEATLVAAEAAELVVTARACDALGCAILTAPIHVVGLAGSCAVSCDDHNPCTTDSRDPSGVCVHAAVPDGAECVDGNLHVKLLGFNDFHGQISAGRTVGGRPVGGAGVLMSYLRAAQAGLEAQTIVVHAGDHVGASPPDSALLQDEPAIQVLNTLANASCAYDDKWNPDCNIVGTLGNHEFDEGKVELLRLLGGGNYATGPFLEDPYLGAKYPVVSANVVDELTGEPMVQPYVIKNVRGVPVAFIGAVLKQTPTIVTPTGVAGLSFGDEADAINSYVPEIQAQGVHAIVVTIHQGGFQSSYTGPTNPSATLSSGPEILDIISRLDSEIDVVISGHSHAFTNAMVPNAAGKAILVTQAFSASTAYDDVDLYIDPVTRDVVGKSAQIVTTYGDAGPGLTPDPMVAPIVTAAQTRVGPLVNRIVGTADVALSRTQNAAGESSLGDLIAEAQRASMGTQMAFMNPGGIRADLDAGDITWGELFTIQPFGNSLVRMNLTGAQVYDVLERQWLGQTSPRIMQVAGFTYTWDPAAPVGSRVVEVRLDGAAIDPAATYSVTCNNFMAAGGDNFTTFVAGADKVGGPIDLDALIDYVEAHSPINVAVDGRIAVTNP